MPANYNNSAWFYDRLSRFVFGNALVQAQVFLLPYIPAGSSVMVIGGGTGWLLEEIARLHPSGLKITYVEVSAKMMGRSVKRFTGNNLVDFVNMAVEDITNPAKYDVIITPFLLDNFSEATLQHVFYHIHSSLKPEGLWLNCDFQLTGKRWQKLLLKTMLLFFRAICKIDAKRLPDIENQFRKYYYETILKQTFFGDFIISKVYRKNERLPKF